MSLGPRSRSGGQPGRLGAPAHRVVASGGRRTSRCSAPAASAQDAGTAPSAAHSTRWHAPDRPSASPWSTASATSWASATRRPRSRPPPASTSSSRRWRSPASASRSTRTCGHRSRPFDIMHVLGFTVAATAGAGLLEELTAVRRPTRAKTPADYDFADFPRGPAASTPATSTSRTGEFGGDQLYLIPGIHSGSALLFYRRDLLGRRRTPAVPTTWAEYLAAAQAADDRRRRRAASISAQYHGPHAVPGGLVHPLHHDGRRADQRQQERQDAAHQPRQPGSHRRAPEPDRPAALLTRTRSRPTASPRRSTRSATGKVAMWPTWATIAGALYNPDASQVADTRRSGADARGRRQPARRSAAAGASGIPKNLPQGTRTAPGCC